MSQSSSLCNIAGLAEGQSGAAGSSTAAAAAAGGGGSAGAASTPPGAAADSPSAGAAGGSELKSRALQHSSSRRSTHSGSQPDLFATGGSSSSSTYSASQGGLVPLVSPQGQALLTEIDECDYLTHIVFRMYEDKRVRNEGVLAVEQSMLVLLALCGLRDGLAIGFLIVLRMLQAKSSAKFST
jgi:hypothetical protein